MIFSIISPIQAYTVDSEGNYVLTPSEINKLIEQAKSNDNKDKIINELESKVDVLEEQLSLKEEKISILEEDKSSLQKEISLLNDKIDEMDKQIELANQKIHLKDEQIAEYQKQNSFDFTGELQILLALKALDVISD